jgi:hypothetical protein
MKLADYVRSILRRSEIPLEHVEPHRRWTADEAHAPGHTHLGPPPAEPPGHAAESPAQHHPGWLRTGGRVDRIRRNERS